MPSPHEIRVPNSMLSTNSSTLWQSKYTSSHQKKEVVKQRENLHYSTWFCMKKYISINICIYTDMWSHITCVYCLTFLTLSTSHCTHIFTKLSCQIWESQETVPSSSIRFIT